MRDYRQYKLLGVSVLAGAAFGLQFMWLIQSPARIVLAGLCASTGLSVGWARWQRRLEERRELGARVSRLRNVAPGTQWTL